MFPSVFFEQITPGDSYMATRREFIRLSLAALTGAGVGTIPFFPAYATQPALGKLVSYAGTPNPHGAFEQMYWLSGDCLSQPITSVVGAPLPVGGSHKTSKSLTVMHFNDLHNMISLPHKKKGTTHRFSQIVQIVEERRENAGHDDIVLLLSGGDDHTGSVYDELVGWTPTEYVVDPAYSVYTAAGVDGAVIGNHELDRGSAVLQKGIRDAARFPVLSANLYGSKSLESGQDYYPAVIGVTKGMRVGLVGLTTPVDTHVNTKDDPDLTVGSPVQAIKNLLPELGKHVDVIVILSHCGYGLSKNCSGKAGAARFLGEGDVMIAQAAGESASCPVLVVGGHTHTPLNANGLESKNVVGGVAILQAGGRGSHLGEARLSLGKNGGVVDARLHTLKKRDQRVAKGRAKYASLEQDFDYDKKFERTFVAPLLKQLEGKLAGVIGQVSGHPDVSDKAVVAKRYTQEMALANYMNDSLMARSKYFPGGPVDISLFNATGFSSGIPTSGPLTFQDWYDVMPFADTVVVVDMTGKQIGQMLKSNAKRLVRPEELAGDNLVDPSGYVSRGFLHFSKGLRYAVSLNNSAQKATVSDVTIHGRPLRSVAGQTFRVAMNSYVAAGAYGESWNGNPIGAGVVGEILGYDVTKLAKLDTGLVYRNEIIAHIKETNKVSPDTGARLDGRLKVK